MKSLTIYKADTVRGILDGTITEWWLPMKKQPNPQGSFIIDGSDNSVVRMSWCEVGDMERLVSPNPRWHNAYAPYAVGDKLFLRERWFPVAKNYRCRNGDKPGRVYEANGVIIQWPQRHRWPPGVWTLTEQNWWKSDRPREWFLEKYAGKSFRWRPAHTMPEWASRCVVEVEEVRVGEENDKWSWIIKFRRVA